jgi:hypothetical protein
MMPRKGMKGTPFSDACRPAWMAGQVASHISISPALMAAVKRGARPCSPNVTAAASMRATQPAPTSMSTWKPPCGTDTMCRSRTGRRIRARTAAMAQPE